MESTTEPKVLDLSPEILSLIFTHLDDAPTSFSLVCKSWRAVAQQEYNLAQYILNRFGRRQAIYYAILHLEARCSSTMFEFLLRAGACTSIYLWRLLLLRCPSVQRQLSYFDRYLPPSWGTKTRLETIKAFGQLSATHLELGGTMEAEIAEERGSEAFRLWENLLLQVSEVRVNAEVQMPVEDMDTAKELLEDLWKRLEEGIVDRGWTPFCPLDPILKDCRLQRAVCLEPRLLPLLNKNGWDYDDEANDAFVRSLLLSRNPGVYEDSDTPGHPVVINGTLTTASRQEILARDVKLYARRFPHFRISARVCGEVMSEVMRGGKSGELSGAILAMGEVGEDGLGFDTQDTLVDSIRLLHGTRNSVVNARNIYSGLSVASITLYPGLVPLARFAHLLGKNRPDGRYQDWTHESSPISGSLRCSSWTGVAVTDPAPPWAEDEDQALDQIADLICNPFLLCAELILREEALRAKPHRDLPEAARRAAVRIVRMPSKGATLLSLVTQHPFLASHIRTEILRHRISLDLLTSPSAGDTSRPLYNSHYPIFLSPLGFDYENALERFIIPLGPHPWVEGCYAADPPPSTRESPFAESVWPLEPQHYFVGEGDKRRDVGRVTGKTMAEAQLDPSDELASWTKEREVKDSLPVAIALLDIFGKDDEALDIVLGHATLNLNPSVVSCYLKEGVPLRPHHLEALDKLQLPRLEAINFHLAMQEAKAATVNVVEDQPLNKPKRKRGGARARRAREKAMAPVVAGAA